MSVNFYQLKQQGRILLSLLMALLLAGGAWANPVAVETISGRVTSAEDGSGLPGVNVVVKGTQNGTITDTDGRFTITADLNATLVFSYIGFSAQEVAIGGRTNIDVVMQLNPETLNEVVVTALGIKREERSLGYSVGKVSGGDMNRVNQENVLNSLSGRLPGVSINSTGGPGSSVSMVIRGMKSLSTDNQPLFVIDGVPVTNSLNNVGSVGRDNRVDYGNAISDLNTDDIESISVLKGASAAALYGSRAGNGVVLITTKSGANSKKLTVNASTTNVFDTPYHFIKTHNRFATGSFSWTPDFNPYPDGVLQLEEGSAYTIGPELNKGYKAIQFGSPLDENGNPIPTELVSHPDNVKNFVNTGFTSTNNISIANSSDLITYRLSYTNMSNKGIIPNSDLLRNSLALSSAIKVSSKLKVSTNLDFTRSSADNRPAGNRGANPMQWAYYVPPHVDIRSLRNYWVPGQEGLQQLTTDNGGGDYNNPYFLAYEVNNSFVRNRIFGNIKTDYQFTPEFSVMARYAMDSYTEERETKMAKSYTGEPNGAYGITNITNWERNADFLATYTKGLGSFNLTVSAGGNARHFRTTDVTTASINGSGINVPGLYTIQNIPQNNVRYANNRSQKVVYSVYGLANIGYKDMVYLDLTARNDWSSTLPVDSRSYFYPSASLSLLPSEMFQMPNAVNMIKVRGSVAQVGNDTQAYQLLSSLEQYSSWNGISRYSTPSQMRTPSLKPEMATSVEMGLEGRFLDNRLRFEATYYTTDNENQIIPVQIAPSSGFTSMKQNAGLLNSKGVELSLGVTPIQRGDWRLDLNFNYSRNTVTVEELPKDVAYLHLWSDARGGSWSYKGDKIGAIYDAEFVKVTDKNSPYYGYPVLDEDGYWQAKAASNVKNQIGNFNPDFLAGMQAALSYKRLTLNLSFDWRQGGQFVSQTYRYMESDMRTQRWLDNLINPGDLTGDALRNYLVANAGQYITDGFNVVGGPTAAENSFPFEYDGNQFPYGGVFNPGVIAEYDENGEIVGYLENLGGPGTKYIPYGENYPWDFTKAATFDASFLKLREISLGYQLPTSFVKSIGLQDAQLSIFARNIMLWTAAKIGIDPEGAFQIESGVQGNSSTVFKQGIERYNVTPWTISSGFKLAITF